MTDQPDQPDQPVPSSAEPPALPEPAEPTAAEAAAGPGAPPVVPPAPPSPAPAKATYGEKFRRRLPVVLLVVGALEVLLAVTVLAGTSTLKLGCTGTPSTALVIGYVVGAIGGVFLWTAIAALLPGRRKDPAPRRIPAAAIGGVLFVLGVGATVYGLTRPPALPEMTIASPDQGCQVFVDTVEKLAKDRASDAEAQPYFEAMQQAAATTYPELAADVAPLAQTGVTAQQSSTAIESVVLRCVEQGHLTEDEVTSWAQRLQTYTS